ncbi:MAG: DUF3108 domain-containing protein [Muribaculaceae bacterium]|nr:DUF3108 domain-containing protein [Muribaculaceae bacterium]
MKHIVHIFLIALIFTAGIAASARSGITHVRLDPEELHYNVMYKWGLINKKAGTATLSLNRGNDGYKAQLTAKSEPWADKIFRLRDTLNGQMTLSDFSPLMYEKIAYEGNEFKHDVVRYDYSVPGKVSARCTRKVVKKDELKVDEERTMEADGAAVDMLTSFYFMRTLPFDKWQKGHVETIDIFSGKRKELLSIVYSGIEKINYKGSDVPTYHITFQFTSGGGKKTSDDMEAWISVDGTRLPLRMEGKLPVGKVQCLLDKQ